MKFVTEPNQLTIELEGFERLWALKHRLQIPHYAISEVDFLAQTPMVQDFKGSLRFLGTALPWRFRAGTFGSKGNKREFWYVRMQQPGVMTITLKDGTLNYGRVRVTCSPQIAQSIADWWRQGK